MKQPTIKIGRKNYTLKFGYGVNRMLSELYGLASYSALGGFMQGLKFGEAEDVTFAQMDFIRDLVYCAISYNLPDNQELTFNKNEIIDVLQQDENLIAEIMQAFVDSFPKQEGKSLGKHKTRTRKK